MKGRAWGWTGLILAAVLLFVVAVAFWLTATTSGARWLLARAAPLLPPALQIAELNGTLLKGVDFRSLSWTDERVRVSVERLDTRVDLWPLLRRQVRIKSLDIRDVDVTVSDGPPRENGGAAFSVDLPIGLRIDTASIQKIRIAIGDSFFDIEEVWLAGQLSGSALQIDRLEIQSAPADISLSGNAALGGDYPANATAAWELRLQDQPSLSGMLRLRGNASRYVVEHDLDAPYEVVTRGTFGLVDDDIVVDLKNTWQLVHVEAGDAPAVDISDGTLRLSGTLGALAFDGNTTIVSDSVPDIAVAVRGIREADRIGFDAVSISNEWGKLLTNGETFISPQFAWNFDFEVSDLDPAAADPRMDGNLQVTGKTTGRIVDQQPILDVRIDDMSGDLNGYPVNGSGSLSYANRRLQVDGAVARVGDNLINFDGSYGDELRVNAALRFSDLRQLNLGAAGRLHGDIRFASNLKTLEAVGKLSGEGLAWQDYFVKTFSADFKVPEKGRGDVALQVADARIATLALATGRLDASGSIQSHTVRADFSVEEGEADFQLTGGFADERWSGAIDRLKLSSDRVGDWTLQEAADFTLSGLNLELGKACLNTSSNAGVLCTTLDYDYSGPLYFDASVTELPLTAFALNLPEGTTVEGTIEAHASGQYLKQRLTADAAFEAKNLSLKAVFEGDELSATFERASARASVVDNTLNGDLEFLLADRADHIRSSLEIADLFNPNSALRGQGSLELTDLSVLSFFVPELANPAGRIAGSVDVTGSLVAPDINGEIRLSDGSFGIRRAGISVTDVDVRLTQPDVGHLSLQGSARSGEGRLDIRGETELSSTSGMNTVLTLSGKNFTLIQLPDWQVSASPDIAVLFDDDAIRVSGEIRIPRANINIPTIPETAERPSADVVVYREHEPVPAKRRMLYVDVRTVLGNAVVLSGFGLTTGLEGSVRITGSSDTPYTSAGRVVLRGGRYQAYGQNLTIESGELIFNGPLINPTLNVRAVRKATDGTVAGIHLTGTPTLLKSQVYSEPAKGDAEALSYLLTGRPLGSADSADGAMLNQAAFALGLSSAGNIASAIRNELGFETLGIQGSAENRQFVAGKRIGERLLIEYAYGMIDNLGTLLLRYQLTNRLILESRSGTARMLDIVYSVKKQ
ncbi:MAG: translocation/assembly module TamB domain-containing protein [Gammaproteobacteria bacterium]|nr:translocation/assembly module TamB domain-containing protein [Gammaproteobacteria bacterium]MDH3481176.1 translocation/assembly module TamB domain-containing protein [Gammaproteobacteria bacterium]